MINLVPFYEGSLGDGERLVVERELLTDSELLVNFFDLKRRREGATDVGVPSPRVWAAISARIQPRRRVMVSLAVAAAAVLFAILYFGAGPRPQSNSMLFDSNPELSQSSGVL